MEAQEFPHPIHRISVEQFHLMIESGVLDEDDRVELIDGEMRDMPPVGPSHNGCTGALLMRFAPALAGRAFVVCQGPLALDDGSELYPDLLVLKSRDDHYQTSNPSADEVLLLIEVSDSTLGFDLNTKLPKYARAGIEVCWIVDVRHKTIHEYRDPDRFGRRYRQLQSVTAGTLLVMVAGVQIEVATADLFRF
jgi:Uma2 family endonuclease